jgi:hypothetical protein
MNDFEHVMSEIEDMEEVVVKTPDPEHLLLLAEVCRRRGLEFRVSGRSWKTVVVRGASEGIASALEETRRLGLELSVARMRALGELLERNALLVPPELGAALGLAEAALAGASGGHAGSVQEGQTAGVEPARPI